VSDCMNVGKGGGGKKLNEQRHVFCYISFLTAKKRARNKNKRQKTN
jgi:hypothetical protein